MVMRGSGRMKLDDEIVELKEWDAVRVPPGTWRGYEAGPEGLEILVIGAPNLGEAPREDVDGQRDWWARLAELAPPAAAAPHAAIPGNGQLPIRPRCSASADGRTPYWSYATRKVPRHGGRVRVAQEPGWQAAGRALRPCAWT